MACCEGLRVLRRGRSADNAHKIHDKSHADTEEPHAPHFTITSDAKTEESSQGGIIERLLTGSSDSLSDDGPIRMPYHPRKTPSPSGSKLNNGDAKNAPTGKWKRGRGWFGSKKWKRISGREADSDPAPGSRRFPEHEKLMQVGRARKVSNSFLALRTVARRAVGAGRRAAVRSSHLQASPPTARSQRSDVTSACASRPPRVAWNRCGFTASLARRMSDRCRRFSRRSRHPHTFLCLCQCRLKLRAEYCA